MKNLNVPYYSQRDNRFNPSGSCNVTSMAMAIKYHYPNFIGDGQYPQFEDYLYDQCTRRGLSRHDPYDLKRLVETLYPDKIRDVFTPNGTLNDVKKSIDQNNPIVIHGYFTRSGHIIVIRGYDDKGFWVNDPWGEYYSTGYDTSVSGENLHYSYGLISRVCSPETPRSPKNLWIHSIQKKVSQ